ncbi:pEARLI1-like lipid transfer protein [Thalictrum thalictroides]|uniref:PEARLI1-like lipid transfer protein n=1 Tax=Thalictrum thalictroides TaxID=46969 RepID=A0A7J6X277_THATH|nr:pEARLI1-like lipid transfer protein [Thalictrum thalictroides]
MGCKTQASAALFLTLNLLLFFAMSTCTTLPTCSIGAPSLSVCSDVLGILIAIPPHPCCSLIDGLDDIEASVCLCNAIKATVAGINLNLTAPVSLILTTCKKKLPSGYQCTV